LVAGVESQKKASDGRWLRPVLDGLCHGEGRSAAAVLLLLAALFHVIAGERLWSAARNLAFDAYQRALPRSVSRFPAVIIDIDERSLSAFGRWPWPRTRLAELIEATRALGALAVGVDIIMPEADDLSPNYLFAGRPQLNPALRAALAQMPSNDAALAQTLRRVPSIIARAALDRKSDAHPAGAQTPAIVFGESPLPHLRSFAAELGNVPEIEGAAAGRGYLNDTRDGDGTVRAMPLVIAVKGALAPALALEILRVATGEKQYTVRANRSGVTGVQIGDSFIPTDLDGRVRLYYAPAFAARRLSAAAILKGEVKAGALTGQVAIVGATAVGISDVAPTPVEARMDGVEIQAQLIENILEGSRLIRPPTARWWELLALFMVALPLIAFFPRLRPSHAAVTFFAAMLVLVLASFLFFSKLHLLYDATFAATANGLIAVQLLFAGFVTSERRRHELAAVLEEERAERLRAAGELRAAREIQMGMLPDPRAIEGLPRSLDFHALLEPAEAVGGDLYDAFMLDDRRLCFMIGDVSGKGVPAALFMALTKTLAKSLVRRQGAPLEQLLRSVNEEISRENPAAMFVTAIVGIVDTRTGEVELCNAGHNPPILLRAGAAPLQLDGAHGPPLCVDQDFAYASQRTRLEPGEILLLLTDGVTEAENEQQAPYGVERALACFTEARIADAATVCAELHADVKRFTAGAPASDDLTIMAIRFTGKE
jgi:serine phosphatase RsbU (regulator of sigma subunit)/CHASE2 domain-containing sensor protein